MTVQHIHVYCSVCKINDIEAVLHVLDEYHSTFEFCVREGDDEEDEKSFVLAPDLDIEQPIAWPSAIEFDVDLEEYSAHLPQAYRQSEELTEDDWNTCYQALNKARDRDGHEGFVRMLSALAPYLLTPLTLHMVTYDETAQYPIAACEWHVRPGDPTVEVNQFQHSQPVDEVVG